MTASTALPSVSPRVDRRLEPALRATFPARDPSAPARKASRSNRWVIVKMRALGARVGAMRELYEWQRPIDSSTYICPRRDLDVVVAPDLLWSIGSRIPQDAATIRLSTSPRSAPSVNTAAAMWGKGLGSDRIAMTSSACRRGRVPPVLIQCSMGRWTTSTYCAGRPAIMRRAMTAAASAFSPTFRSRLRAADRHDPSRVS
jgi:hypothetical protein